MSNRGIDFKSAERGARCQLEITSTITHKLYDTKSYFQLIVSETKRVGLSKSTVKKRISKSVENF